MIDFNDYSQFEIKQMLCQRGELFDDCIGNMEKYGGGFVQELSNLCRHADNVNLKKIAEAFFNYFTEYQPKLWKK